jgi:hypothetical protein
VTLLRQTDWFLAGGTTQGCQASKRRRTVRFDSAPERYLNSVNQMLTGRRICIALTGLIKDTFLINIRNDSNQRSAPQNDITVAPTSPRKGHSGCSAAQSSKDWTRRE